jgi:DNA-binding Lrp family transcriptional regulator
LDTLDKFDIAILGELQADARLTNAELAQRVGLSAAPCWRRARASRRPATSRATAPRSTATRSAWACWPSCAWTPSATRRRHAPAGEALQQLPEVISCHYISGTGTFELQVVAQDLDSFSRFALKSLINLPNVKDLHTSFSLGEVKASSALPLAHLKPAPGKAGAR